MAFNDEVRALFKKYDPARIRLAKRIAAKFKHPSHQKIVLKRLKEIYAAGGPDKAKLNIVSKSEKIAAAAAVASVATAATNNIKSEEE